MVAGSAPPIEGFKEELAELGWIEEHKCLAELLSAPEPKADRQHRVGAPGERLLPWTSEYKRWFSATAVLILTLIPDRIPGWESLETGVRLRTEATHP